MKKNLRNTAAIATMALAVTLPAEAQSLSHTLVCTSTYGDFMGSVPETKCTAQKVYYYDGDMNIVAVRETATEAKGDDQITQYYDVYRYDENNLLTSIDVYQYGLYDYGDRSMMTSATTTTFTYNDKGQKIEERQGDNVSKFEYDAQGNMVKEERYRTNRGAGVPKLGKTLVYSDFKNGKPCKVVSTHTDQTLTGDFYEETYEYNELGLMTHAYRECNVDATIKVGSFSTIELVSGTFMQEEVWTYEGEQVTSYIKYSGIDESTGEKRPYLKIVYNILDQYNVTRQSYTSYGDEWFKSGTKQQDTYANFTGMTKNTEPTLISVSQSKSMLNTLDVEFKAPAAALNDGGMKFCIFRNGDIVATIAMKDAGTEGCLLKKAPNGNLIYIDKDLCNGNYEYFVQTLGANDQPYCASKCMGASVYTELPAAYGLCVTGWTTDKTNKTNNATVRFKAPKALPEHGFISNSVLVGNAQVSEAVFTTNEDTETVVVIPQTMESQIVYVMTRYKYGKAFSEKLTIVPGTLTEPGEEPADPVLPELPGEEPEQPGVNPDQPGENPDQPGENPDQPGQDEPQQPEDANKPIVLVGPAEYHVLTLSPNGKWATGYFRDFAELNHGFRWNLESNQIELLSTTEESLGWTISDDGVVGGSFTDHTISENPLVGMVEPGYYRNGEWQSVEKPNGFRAENENDDKGQGYAISADGRTLTGSISINGHFSPAVWVDGKLTHLLDISNPNGMQDGAPYCISPNGNIVGGWSYRYNRACALWYLKSDGTNERKFISNFESPWSSVDRFSPNGKKVLYGGDWDETIDINDPIQYANRIYDLETGESTKLPTIGPNTELMLFGISDNYTCVGSDRSYDYGHAIIYPNGTGNGEYLDKYLEERGVDFDALGVYRDPETGERRIFRGQDISADDNTFVLVAYMGEAPNVTMRSIIVMLNHDAKHAAPVSLEAKQLSGIKTVAVSWAAPVLSADGITGYRISRNGEQITEVAADQTTYYDRNLADGNYSYTVTTLYADGAEMTAEVKDVTVAPQPVSCPSGLYARQKGMYSITAQWEAPASNLITKNWYNHEKNNLQGFGIGLDDVSIEMGIGFKHEEMANYEGCTIQKVDFFPMSEQQSWKLNIYQYDANGKPQCIYTQPVTQQLNYKHRNTVVLDKPLAVPTEGDMIVAFEVYVAKGTQNIMGMDYGRYTAGYSDLLRFTDEEDFYSYYYMREEQGYPDFATFMIDVVMAEPGTDSSVDEVKAYRVTLDGQEMGEVSTTSYSSDMVAASKHTLGVQAVFADGRQSDVVTTDVTVKYAFTGVKNVEITNDNTVVTATWQAPIDQDVVTVTYAAGNAAPESVHGPQENNYGIIAGVEYNGDMLRGYNGYQISSLDFMPMADATFTFYVYEDRKMIAEVQVEDYTLNIWNSVPLEEPITINERNTYLIALDCYDVVPDMAPLAIDCRLPLVYTSDLYSLDGEEWKSICLESGMSGNWMLRMNLSEPEAKPAQIDGYDVRFDGTKVNTAKVTETTYTHDLGEKANGNHNVRINTYYAGRANAYNGTLVNFTIDMSGITQPMAETFRICQGTDQIVLEGPAVSQVKLIASDGHTAASATGNVIGIADIPAGIYVLRATASGRNITAKVVIE